MESIKRLFLIIDRGIIFFFGGIAVIEAPECPKNLDDLKIVVDHFDCYLDYLLFDEVKFEKKASIEDFRNEINLGQLEIILRKPKG